ncbi:NFX1-type zinc finger-containing protein 1 [Frankliniella fusca]|uniref:NFX1-type zinc finger-containing protein 1 n=1 Tax=Frankliniella fusca TaxID=407009 RepID=A0AAE1LIN6_9NEOP|nr:NFX1-type zinc finger-containing protein 1 [Frankliniella fusca]
MSSHAVSTLFPTIEDVALDARNVPLQKLKEEGPYGSLEELLKLHIDLLSEDYLCALHDQVSALRRDPEQLRSLDHYTVTGFAEHYIQRGRFTHPTGVEFRFDPSLYEDVEWDDEKRLMRNNLVLLTDTQLRDFTVGLIHESGEKLLKKGRIVVKIITGFNSNGFAELGEQEPYIGRTWQMVESSPFHFPYLQVTKVLQRDLGLISLYEKMGMVCPYEFYDEIVYGINSPSRQAKYLSKISPDDINRIRRKMRADLNTSQYRALKKVLENRVALVQGPPGTGKTFLGAKIAQLFVELKRMQPLLLQGPIVVIAMSNHAVQEFLIRCKSFSEKIIHCCSDKHDRGQVDFGRLQKEHDKAAPRDKAEVMKLAEVIGMTTTRACCLRSDLDRLNIKIVIVEEAAEALESHILAATPTGTQHLVQIGDHRQLRPICAHEDLARLYKLDLSLFERLLNNGAVVPMLSEQRRMRPCIADLVRIMYPNLTDHASTLRRPRETKGYSNRAEAEIAVELANYLLLRGYDPSEITILTTYRKQLKIILQLIGDEVEGGPKKVAATTVDSFQGEENTIIILSFVRSNLSGDIGFLKMANRACVALSRARDGFFMLGNLPCLSASKVPIYEKMEEVLTKANRCGPTLPLVCPHGESRSAAGEVSVAAEGAAALAGQERPDVAANGEDAELWNALLMNRHVRFGSKFSAAREDQDAAGHAVLGSVIGDQVSPGADGG